MSDEIKAKHYPKTAIIIVSYNACKMMQENIWSIRKTVKEGSYHIYVVDNSSTDGIGEWLKEQEQKYSDISVMLNSKNVGFPAGCNQGVKLAESLGDTESDIFLLNNDTLLCENSLNNLKAALYSSDDVGATGAISNYVGNKQQMSLPFNTANEYVEFGKSQNIPYAEEIKSMICEERVRLSGFAMLIKREVWKNVGGMDERFSPGYFEDDDLSMKILLQGKRILLCLNSFIYHAGSQSFSKVKDLNSILLKHYQLFGDIYGFPIVEYAYPDLNKLAEFKFDENREYNFLHIGCGIGASIKYIRSKYKNVHVFGVEKDKYMNLIASATDEVYMSISEFVNENDGIVVDAIYTDMPLLDSLPNEEYEALKKAYSENTILNARSSINYSKVKLVIWNPGEIFWKADMINGNIVINNQRMELIKSLADCGIISSVTSQKRDGLEKYIFENTGIMSMLAFNDFGVDDIADSISRKIHYMNIASYEVLYINDDVDVLVDIDMKIDGIVASDSGAVSELLDFVSNHQPSDSEHKALKRVKELDKIYIQSKI